MPLYNGSMYLIANSAVLLNSLSDMFLLLGWFCRSMGKHFEKCDTWTAIQYVLNCALWVILHHSDKHTLSKNL